MWKIFYGQDRVRKISDFCILPNTQIEKLNCKIVHMNILKDLIYVLIIGKNFLFLFRRIMNRARKHKTEKLFPFHSIFLPQHVIIMPSLAFLQFCLKAMTYSIASS